MLGIEYEKVIKYLKSKNGGFEIQPLQLEVVIATMKVIVAQTVY